jgi:hypothetical protein
MSGRVGKKSGRAGDICIGRDGRCHDAMQQGRGAQEPASHCSSVSWIQGGS